MEIAERKVYIREHTIGTRPTVLLVRLVCYWVLLYSPLRRRHLRRCPSLAGRDWDKTCGENKAPRGAAIYSGTEVATSQSPKPLGAGTQAAIEQKLRGVRAVRRVQRVVRGAGEAGLSVYFPDYGSGRLAPTCTTCGLSFTTTY